MKWFSLAIILIYTIAAFCQKSKEIDSLKKVIATTTSDSIRILSYYAWDDLIYLENPELDREINEKIIDLCEDNLQNKKLTASLWRFFTKYLASSKNVIGLILVDEGNYRKAQDIFLESLALAESIGDSLAMAAPTNNLGLLFKVQNLPEEALKYYEKAMTLDGEKNDASKAIYLNNIGTCYFDLDKYDLAVKMYRESILLSEISGEVENLANAVGNVGEVYFVQSYFDSALVYFERSIEIDKQTGNIYGLTHHSQRKGMVYYQTGKPKEAIRICREALDSAELYQYPQNELECHFCLYLSFKKLQDHASALFHYEIFESITDTLKSQENLESIRRMQYEIEYEKQKVADSLEVVGREQIVQLELQNNLRRKENQQYLLYGGIFSLLLVGGLIYRGYTRKKKDNETITYQKQEVEEKNKEILDSIVYAKRIQTAILPPEDFLQKVVPDSFVLYKPKDIVAGDFYYLEEVDGHVFLAVADCTGHGVPGAMVSVVCHNALNRSVREFKLKEPGEILDKTRALVVETFSKSRENVKDGMDISLISWEKGKNVLHYAGANNPIYIVRSAETPEIEEIKADKQPIGMYEKSAPFKTQQIILNNHDVVYCFTDGFADQFGGPDGKKFKYKQLKDKCLELYKKPLSTQKDMLDEAFENWKGSLEQIDDVCILGLSLF